MAPDLVDSVWAFMKKGELYSPEDMANLSQQPIDIASRVLGFLARYGFAEMVTKREPLFRKSAGVPNPTESLTFLRRIVADRSLRDVEAPV